MLVTRRFSHAIAQFSVVVAAMALVGCSSLTQADHVTESDAQGQYTVLDESFSRGEHLQTVELHLYHATEDAKGALPRAYLALRGKSPTRGFFYIECGDRGPLAHRHMAGNADPDNVEMLTCWNNRQGFAFVPVADFITTKDGSAFQYKFGPLDFHNKTLEVTTGRLLVISWGPDLQTGYVLRRDVP
jgi:hypothetical protein